MQSKLSIKSPFDADDVDVRTPELESEVSFGSVDNMYVSVRKYLKLKYVELSNQELALLFSVSAAIFWILKQVNDTTGLLY